MIFFVIYKLLLLSGQISTNLARQRNLTNIPLIHLLSMTLPKLPEKDTVLLTVQLVPKRRLSFKLKARVLSQKTEG